MVDAAPFAYVRRLAYESMSVRDAWNTATKEWAQDADCANIDTEDSSEFFRVWLVCVMYGVCLITAVSVPYYLCTSRSDKQFDDSEDLLEEKKHHVVDLGDDSGKKGDVEFHDPIDDPTPNINKAKEHWMRTSPLTLQGKWRSVFFTKASDLSEVGGIGVELYFRLLRSLGLCFAYLSIFSLPSLMFSWEGNFVPDLGSPAAKTTIGNMGRMASLGVPQAERLVIIGCQGMPLVKITKYFGWCDFFGVVTYILFIAWYRFKFIPQAAIRDDEQNVTPKDFAVEIDFLPEKLGSDQAQYEEKLRAHVVGMISGARRKEGTNCQTQSEVKVPEVALVRDFSQRLEDVKMQAELTKKQDIAKAYGKEAYERKLVQMKGKMPKFFGKVPTSEVIAKNAEKLAEALQPEQDLSVLRAYCLMNSPDDKARLITMYRFSKFRLGRCCQSRQMMFEGKAIRVRDAPEPSNILWYNQDVPWRKRVMMRTVMFLLWLVVMIASLVLIYLTQDAAHSGTKAGVQTIGDHACDAGTKTEGYVCNALVAAEWTYEHVKEVLIDDKDKVDCWCGSIGHSEILRKQELANGVCRDFMINSGMNAGMGVAASVIVVVINVILQAMIAAFVDKEKHTSVSSRDSSVMVKVAASQFLNTAAIIFLLHYNGLGIFDGSFSDFERGWYAVVGSALCLNMFLNAFTGAIVKVIMTLVTTIKRWPCFVKKMKHQAELLAVYENPEFDMAMRYAEVLTTCFCTLVYSSGLPILNFFAVIYCFSNYWVDKWILLQQSRRPPAYDTKMPRDATELLLFAAPLHIVFAIGMYSHPCTFPSAAIGGNLASMADKANSMANEKAMGASDTSSFAERVSRDTTWMSFVALCMVTAFLAMLIVKSIAGTTFGSVLTCMRHICCGQSAQIRPESPVGTDGQKITWDKAYNYIHTTRPPASYRMDQNRRYAPLVSYLRSEHFEEARTESGKVEKIELPPSTPGAAGSSATGSGAAATPASLPPGPEMPGTPTADEEVAVELPPGPEGEA